MVGDIDDGEAGVTQRAGGAAGGEDFDVGLGERLGEGDEPGLVRDGDEGAADGNGGLGIGHGRFSSGLGRTGYRAL